jgi:hypothetical protein
MQQSHTSLINIGLAILAAMLHRGTGVIAVFVRSQGSSAPAGIENHPKGTAARTTSNTWPPTTIEGSDRSAVDVREWPDAVTGLPIWTCGPETLDRLKSLDLACLARQQSDRSPTRSLGFLYHANLSIPLHQLLVNGVELLMVSRDDNVNM